MATAEEIEKVIESTDMVDLVSPYVTLTKQGKSYKGLCPFHDEKTPSFVVSQEKHLAHCFGCGKGGNPIQFLMDIKQISFNEALSFLAQKNGISVQVKTKSLGKDYSKYYEMMDLALKFYVQSLTLTKSGKTALSYLYQRGLDDKAILEFGIGYAPKSMDSLYKVLKDANYLELDMLDLGLIGKNDKGYYDIFMNRIMFPIKDEQGHTIGFSARLMEKDENQPKYINTKETFLYHKANVLYHLDLAKSEILRKKRVILHEGQMDVIASTRAGFKESICTMGTALSLEQASRLKKYCDHAIICYDGDKAGIAASKKAIKIFQKAGFKVHLVLLPNGLDPDDFVKERGLDAYSSYFEEHIIDDLEYLFEVVFLNRNLKDSSVLEEIKLDAFKTISLMSSKTSQEKFLKELALRLSVSFESLCKDYDSYFKTNKPIDFVEEQPEDVIFDDWEKPIAKPITSIVKEYEIRLFLYARSSKQKALDIDRRIGENINAFDPHNRELWMTLIDMFYTQYDTFDDTIFCSLLSPELKDIYVHNLDYIRGKTGIYGDEDLNCIIQKMNNAGLDAKNDVLSEQIHETNDLDVQVKKLEEMFNNNRKKMMSTRRK